MTNHLFLKVTPNLLRTALLFLTLTAFSPRGFSQKTDSIKQEIQFKGTLSATNNGFSLIPTFSLGKPAVVTTFFVGSNKRRFSFEPEFRYSMEFKPWSFIFIWRYALVRKEHFQLKLGTHLPALNFVSGPVIKNGVEQEAIQARRFFPVFEVIPNWVIRKNFHLGMYLQYGHGFEKELTQHAYFFSLRPGFNYIPLTKHYYLRFNPQFYYLKLDAHDGIYTAASLTLARRNFPFSISTLMNKRIDSTIAGKGFDWNVSLTYSFANSYVKR